VPIRLHASLSTNRALMAAGPAVGAAGLQTFDASGELLGHYGLDGDTERAQLCEALGA
jgi:hypothetical protein